MFIRFLHLKLKSFLLFALVWLQFVRPSRFFGGVDCIAFIKSICLSIRNACKICQEPPLALADDGVNRMHVLIAHSYRSFTQHKFGMIGDFSTKINIQLKYLVSFKRPNFLRHHLMMLWCNGTLMCARNVCQFLTLCRHSQNAMCHAYRLVRNYTIRITHHEPNEWKKIKL